MNTTRRARPALPPVKSPMLSGLSTVLDQRLTWQCDPKKTGNVSARTSEVMAETNPACRFSCVVKAMSAGWRVGAAERGATPEEARAKAYEAYKRSWLAADRGDFLP